MDQLGRLQNSIKTCLGGFVSEGSNAPSYDSPVGEKNTPWTFFTSSEDALSFQTIQFLSKRKYLKPCILKSKMLYLYPESQEK
jgi:hypothetical protein